MRYRVDKIATWISMHCWLQKTPDELRTLALKLLADLEQQTQRNKTQAGYIQRLEKALKMPVSGASGIKGKPSRANSAGCSMKISRLMPPILSNNWLPCYLNWQNPNCRRPNASLCRRNCPREEVRLVPGSDSCPDCGYTLRFIRDEISKRLEYVPARFIVHRDIRLLSLKWIYLLVTRKW